MEFSIILGSGGYRKLQDGILEALGGSLGCARRALGELLERFSSICCVPWATFSAIFDSQGLPRPENGEKLEFAHLLHEIAIFLRAESTTNEHYLVEFSISLLNLIEFCRHLQNLAIWRSSEAPRRHFGDHRRLEDGILSNWSSNWGLAECVGSL